MNANNNPQQSTHSQRREQAAADALRSLIQDLLQETFPQLAEENPELALNLSLNIQCGAPGQLSFDPPLRQQIRGQAEAYLLPLEPFQFGSVYDFHSQRNCRPPDALAVFAGYDPMGHPKWSTVKEVLTDGLPLKIFSGKALKTEQLKSQGKNDKRFNILGQVVVGPLPVPPAYQPLTQQAEWALTCQVVETRDSQHHFGLKLNLLTGNLLPDEWEEMMQELPLRDLNHAVLSLQEELLALEHLARQAWTHQDTPAFNHALQNVPRLLGDFSARLS